MEQWPFVAAALIGVGNGRMLIDDAAAPRTPFLLVRETWGYLAGDPANDAFNQALHRALFSGQVTAAGLL